MRVAHVVNAFSPTSETFIYDYVTELAAQGVDCEVVTFHKRNEESRPFAPVHLATSPPSWSPQTVSTRALEKLSGRPWHGESVLWERSLERTLRQVEPDLIHAHFGPKGVLVADIAERMGVPMVVSYHGYDISSYMEKPEWLARYERMWPMAGAITVVSELQKQVLERAGAPIERVHVVRVGKRMDAFECVPRIAPLRRFVCLGRMVEKKGHVDLVEVIARLRARGHDVTCAMLGGGPLLEDVRARAAELDVERHLDIQGEVPFSQAMVALRTSDVFVLYSKTASNGDKEGVPTVLMEAQAMGLPCLSTWHAGIPEVFPPEHHALLAPEGDIDAMVERAERLLEMSAQELRVWAQRGRAKVEAEFSLPGQCQRLREIYASLMA